MLNAFLSRLPGVKDLMLIEMSSGYHNKLDEQLPYLQMTTV